MLENNSSIGVYCWVVWFYCAIMILALDIKIIIKRERAMIRKVQILIGAIS